MAFGGNSYGVPRGITSRHKGGFAALAGGPSGPAEIDITSAALATNPIGLDASGSELVLITSRRTTPYLEIFDAETALQVARTNQFSSRSANGMRDGFIDETDKVYSYSVAATRNLQKHDGSGTGLLSANWTISPDPSSGVFANRDGSQVVYATVNGPSKVRKLNIATGATTHGFTFSTAIAGGAFSGKEGDRCLFFGGASGSYNDFFCWDPGALPASADATGADPGSIFAIDTVTGTGADFNITTCAGYHSGLISSDRLTSGGWWGGLMSALGQYGGSGGPLTTYQGPYLFHITRAGVIDIEVDLRLVTQLPSMTDRAADIKDIAVGPDGRIYVIFEPVYGGSYPPATPNLPNELIILETDGSFLWSSYTGLDNATGDTLPSYLSAVAVTASGRIAVLSGWHPINTISVGALRTDDVYFLTPPPLGV
jgi:hypothetical protein